MVHFMSTWQIFIIKKKKKKKAETVQNNIYKSTSSRSTMSGLDRNRFPASWCKSTSCSAEV